MARRDARARSARGSRPTWPSLPMPILARIPDTVESAIPDTSAISGPVNRNRLARRSPRPAARWCDRDPIGAAGPITKPGVSLGSVATHPLTSAADADAGGLGRLRQRPLPLDHNPAELPTPFQTERSVSVQIHPVSSLVGLRCLAALSLQGGPDGPTYSGTTPRHQATGPAGAVVLAFARGADRRGALSAVLVGEQKRVPVRRFRRPSCPIPGPERNGYRGPTRQGLTSADCWFSMSARGTLRGLGGPRRGTRKSCRKRPGRARTLQLARTLRARRTCGAGWSSDWRARTSAGSPLRASNSRTLSVAILAGSRPLIRIPDGPSSSASVLITASEAWRAGDVAGPSLGPSPPRRREGRQLRSDLGRPVALVVRDDLMYRAIRPWASGSSTGCRRLREGRSKRPTERSWRSWTTASSARPWTVPTDWTSTATRWPALEQYRRPGEVVFAFGDADGGS